MQGLSHQRANRLRTESGAQRFYAAPAIHAQPTTIAATPVPAISR